MVRLASGDGPAALCLQELPVWSLPKLEEWSGMRAFGAVAARPLLGSARLGGAFTELNHGLLRSALTGQANAILLCHAVRAETNGRVVTVANTHCSSVPDRRCQNAELLRAAVFADAFAEPDDTLVLAGDFNTVIGESTTLEQLARPDWGFSEPIPGLDQVLVRGAKT